MKGYLGEELVAQISGMTPNGFFVYFTETHCDGFVPLKALRGDWFEIDETHTSMVGKNTGMRYRLGDMILTSITDVSVRQRQVTATSLGPIGTKS